MSRYAMCPNCGRRMYRVKDLEGNWDRETYTCYHCSGEEYTEEEPEECISVRDAAQIWASKGKDEDYMFGYTEEELEDAL